MRDGNVDMSGGRAWNKTIPGGGGSINGRITGLRLCSTMKLSATFDSLDVYQSHKYYATSTEAAEKSKQGTISVENIV